MKKRLNAIVDQGDWDISELSDTSDCSDCEIVDCIQYYVTDYVCRKMIKRMRAKKSECLTCTNAFSSFFENLIHGTPAAEFLLRKTNGG